MRQENIRSYNMLLRKHLRIAQPGGGRFFRRPSSELARPLLLGRAKFDAKEIDNENPDRKKKRPRRWGGGKGS
jgi:hypothetical protein